MSYLSNSHRTTRFAATAAALVIGITACTPSEPGSASSTPPTLPAFTTTSPATTTSSPAAEATDYSRLLLTAADLSDDEDIFVERSRNATPDGAPGASAFFVNEADTRAITDTVLVYPDAPTAAASLKQATDALPTLVSGGTPKPAGVGGDSVVITGTSPDEDKAVTVLLYSEGSALVRLRFESAEGDATTDRFVTSIGKMQQIALRIGLSDAS